MKLLTRADVAGLLRFPEYVDLVERAFRLHATGQSLAPQLMHVDAAEGEFHIKGGGLFLDRWYFALKANGSFFQNPARRGLPAIQGAILLFDAESGTPLALLDSAEITIQRTGAATAVAARLLARPDSTTAIICGCGRQGQVHLTALGHVLPLERVYLWDANPEAARRLAAACETGGVRLEVTEDLAAAVPQCDVIVTCTPSRQPFIKAGWVRRGTFVAAVGADSPGKQEVEATLLAPPTKVVVDLLSQAADVGELQHALAAGLLSRGAVHAEIGDILSGRKPGRANPNETILFDATGTALQDVVGAAAAYEKACQRGIGADIDLAKAY